MIRLPSRRLTIGQNLALSTIFQVATIFIVLLFTYFSRIDEIGKELDESGALIATTVAENSQYGIVSGNHSYIESSLRNIMGANKNIYAIEVHDKYGNVVAELRAKLTDDAEKRSYRSKITIDSASVNTVDFESSASVPNNSSQLGQSSQNPITVGDVTVVLSAARLLGDKRTRLLFGMTIAAAFLLLSIGDGFRRSRALTRPLIDTVAAIRAIREGSYSVTFTNETGPELRELQEGIVSMAESLRQFHQGLEALVIARTHELQLARDEALKASAERKQLVERVSTAAEAERQAIAVEIHDHLNALVVVARLEAKAIVKLTKHFDTAAAAGRANEGRSQELEQRADNLLKTVTEIYQMGRDIIKRLRPEVIDQLGLDAAVSEIVTGYDSLYPECNFYYDSTGDFIKLDSNVAISTYRLIQESLSNIVKHANAKNVQVQVYLSDRDNKLRISIQDDGDGFDMRNYKAGIGLIGMRERISALGGTLKVHSGVGEGTTISAEISVKLLPAGST